MEALELDIELAMEKQASNPCCHDSCTNLIMLLLSYHHFAAVMFALQVWFACNFRRSALHGAVMVVLVLGACLCTYGGFFYTTEEISTEAEEVRLGDLNMELSADAASRLVCEFDKVEAPAAATQNMLIVIQNNT